MLPATDSLRILASGEVREWLRTVVDALLEEPGGLYNPVFVGPCVGVASLAEAVASAAGPRSLPVSTGLEPPGVGVWLVAAAVAEEALDGGAVPRPGVQWVVWGACAASGLPDRLAGWVGSKGLAVDPLAGAASAIAAWSMAPAVAAAQAGSVERGERGFVFVSGEAEELGGLAAELQLLLELELGGCVWRGPAEAWGDGDRETSGRVVVVGPRCDLAGLGRRLDRLGAGPLCGVVLECESARRIASLSEWAGLERRTWWARRGCARAVAGEEVFPRVGDLLVGSAGVAGAPADIIQFNLGAISLAEILQAAEGWGRSGTLVLFGVDRVGWIRLGHGRVTGVGIVGGEQADGTREGVVFDLLAVLGRCGDAGVVFVPGEAGEDGVPIGRAVMAIAHSAGEVGVHTRSSAPPMRVHEVAEVLVAWGVPEVARTFLQRAEEALGWGPEEDILLGNLYADRNPQAAAARLRHGAMRAFTERSEGAGVALYFDGMLNALLVEVRAGQTSPAVAWAIVGNWLRDAGSAWATTGRQVAIWMELALRAGAVESARLAQARLAEVANGSPDAWASLLALDIEGPGGNGDS